MQNDNFFSIGLQQQIIVPARRHLDLLAPQHRQGSSPTPKTGMKSIVRPSDAWRYQNINVN